MRLDRNDKLSSTIPAGEDVVLRLWVIDRTKHGLPLTMYPTNRTKVITAKRRDEISRALTGEAYRISRGLFLRKLKLKFILFLLKCKLSAIKLISHLNGYLFQFGIRIGHVWILSKGSDRNDGGNVKTPNA